ncbi:MAG TPA: sugar phosphate nucleotidyltransferase [Gemmatimonadaceae bacterium]|nr:sugar phosphate nucleotidyltransferase [Gemmatimonadaceae bacterium]
MSRWAVVLAGGVGSRFWPLSTPARPKQLLPLVTDRPLLRDSFDRLTPIVDPKNILVLTNAGLDQALAALLPELPKENFVVEPKPAGTAAALAWAALEIERRDGPAATMICIHADWSIEDEDRFRATLVRAEEVAVETETLVTVGIVPTRPDPGFGYIQPVPGKSGEPAKVKRFVEKPDRVAAARMAEEGFLWNSGIFVWRVETFLAEARTHAKELSRAFAGSAGRDAATFFGSLDTAVSVDVAVLERSARVTVVPGKFGWDDIGTWAALRRVRPQDDSGNVTNGDVYVRDGTDNVVHAEAGTVVVYGVDNLVVVSRDGLTLVTTTEKATDLKGLLESLPQSVRSPT